MADCRRPGRLLAGLRDDGAVKPAYGKDLRIAGGIARDDRQTARGGDPGKLAGNLQPANLHASLTLQEVKKGTVAAADVQNTGPRLNAGGNRLVVGADLRKACH